MVGLLSEQKIVPNKLSFENAIPNADGHVIIPGLLISDERNGNSPFFEGNIDSAENTLEEAIKNPTRGYCVYRTYHPETKRLGLLLQAYYGNSVLRHLARYFLDENLSQQELKDLLVNGNFESRVNLEWLRAKELDRRFYPISCDNFFRKVDMIRELYEKGDLSDARKQDGKLVFETGEYWLGPKLRADSADRCRTCSYMSPSGLERVLSFRDGLRILDIGELNFSGSHITVSLEYE